MTLLGPNMLSDITDAIQNGIAPDTDKLELIVTTVSDNMQQNAQKLAEQQAAAAVAAGMDPAAAGAAGDAVAMGSMQDMASVADTPTPRPRAMPPRAWRRCSRCPRRRSPR